MEYNKTQLSPDLEFSRHIFHRDQFAHYLRWTHVIKSLKRDMSIIDFGCGSANLLEVIYRNKYRAKRYVGLDIRKNIIDKNIGKWKMLDYAEFHCVEGAMISYRVLAADLYQFVKSFILS